MSDANDGESSNILSYMLGDKTCYDDTWTRCVWYFGLSFIITIVFLILSLDSVSRMIDTASGGYGILMRTVLFFALFLVSSFMFSLWKQKHPICERDLKEE